MGLCPVPSLPTLSHGACEHAGEANVMHDRHKLNVVFMSLVGGELYLCCSLRLYFTKHYFLEHGEGVAN